MLAKAINGKLSPPPATYSGDGGTICNFHSLPDETLREYGYKDVVDTLESPPDEINAYVKIFEDTGERVEAVSWAKIERPVPETTLKEIFVAAIDSGLLSEEQALEAGYLVPLWDKSFLSDKTDIIRQHKGLFYKNIVPISNTAQNLEPGTAGSATIWTQIGNPAEEWPEWIQPIGAHNAYAKGAKVSYNGKHWVSNIDANTWAPGVHGWDEVS